MPTPFTAITQLINFPFLLNFSSVFVDLAIELIFLASNLLLPALICGHAFQPGMFFKSTLFNSRRFHEKDTFGFGRGGDIRL
jgi:hypothetical protein